MENEESEVNNASNVQYRSYGYLGFHYSCSGTGVGGLMTCSDVVMDVTTFSRWLEDQELQSAERRGRAKQYTYSADIGAFDIETTNLVEVKQSVLYHWQFQYGGQVTVVGRTVDSLIELFTVLNRKLAADGLTMLVFVHNLSFEFQFMAGWHEFSADDVLIVDDRTILNARWGSIEFRCSYLQSGISLAALCDKYHVKHSKLSGDDFDYRKRRFPWTPMTDEELEYCLNDVRGLVEAMDARRQERGDTWYSFPLYENGVHP